MAQHSNVTSQTILVPPGYLIRTLSVCMGGEYLFNEGSLGNISFQKLRKRLCKGNKSEVTSFLQVFDLKEKLVVSVHILLTKFNRSLPGTC